MDFLRRRNVCPPDEENRNCWTLSLSEGMETFPNFDSNETSHDKEWLSLFAVIHFVALDLFSESLFYRSKLFLWREKTWLTHVGI